MARRRPESGARPDRAVLSSVPDTATSGMDQAQARELARHCRVTTRHPVEITPAGSGWAVRLLPACPRGLPPGHRATHPTGTSGAGHGAYQG
ncbi:MAG: hypothetical protein ACRDZY_02710, partial [Acidimicrobiales bacterium]